MMRSIRRFSTPAGRSVKFLVASGAVLTLLTQPVQAQGAQKYGFQVSALATSIGTGGTSAPGVGFEPQLRFNRLYRSPTAGVISLGLGGQWSTHTSGPDDITITGAFVEPRWVPVLPYERVFPYVAGRVAVLNQSNNFGTSSSGLAFGAGGGLAYVVNANINIDAGVTIISQSFGDFTFTRPGFEGEGEFNTLTTYAAKLGISIGFPR